MPLTADSEALLVDRFAYASMNEAMRLVDEGVATARDIDLAMRAGAGYAVGPLEQADTIGLDAVLAKLKDLAAKYGENYKPGPTLENLVASAALGKKSGMGFHSYAAAPTRPGAGFTYPAFSNILVEVHEAIALLTINRPPANSLSRATLDEIAAAFDLIGQDDEARVVVVTGAGQHVFIGGADINEFVELDEPATRASVRRGVELYNRIEHFPKPVIAAVNGVCVGGGNELAMACDFRIAAESAHFGQPEIALGIIPGWGGTQRLTRIVGKGRALELLMTGDRIPADAALHYGLVNKVVPDNELMPTARNIARRLAALPPFALTAIKQAVNSGVESGVDAGAEAEMEGVLRIFKTADAREGVSAFLEKRRPRFTGS